MKDLVLQDIELCKQVAPILDRLGIEPDDEHIHYYYCKYCAEVIPKHKYWDLLDRLDEEYTHIECPGCEGLLPKYEVSKNTTPAYRQDKLAAGLPEWCFGRGYGDHLRSLDLPRDGTHMSIGSEIENFQWCMWSKRGQPQLEATARLLILLEKEGLV